MKKKILAVTPAVCFLVGFLICVLAAPLIAGSGDGETYFQAIGQVSFWEIFLNNALMCGLFILGCGVISSVLLLVQGFTFGGTYILWTMMGNAAGDFFLLFLPHVVFEFIAMALAGYLGFRLLDLVLHKNGQTLKGLLREHKWTLTATFAAVLVGALVECYLTPWLYTIC